MPIYVKGCFLNLVTSDKHATDLEAHESMKRIHNIIQQLIVVANENGVGLVTKEYYYHEIEGDNEKLD